MAKTKQDETSQKRELATRYLKTEVLEWRKLQWFQPEEFKSMSIQAAERYLESLDNLDIIREFKVWERSPDDLFIIDAHHLQKILLVGEAKGLFTVPDKLPCHFYQIEDDAEAAKMVLAHSSTYARTTYDGMDALMQAHDLAIEEAREFVEINGISFVYWDDDLNLGEKEFEQSDNPGPGDQNSLESQMAREAVAQAQRYDIKKMKVVFPVEAFEHGILLAAIQRIRRKHSLPDNSAVLKFLINLDETDLSFEEAGNAAI